MSLLVSRVASAARNSPLVLLLVVVPGSASDDDGRAIGGRSNFTAERGGSAARPPDVTGSCSLLCPSPSTLGAGDVSVCSPGSKVFKSSHKKSITIVCALAAAAPGLPRVDRLACVGGKNLFSEHAGLFWCVRVARKGATVGESNGKRKRPSPEERRSTRDKYESTPRDGSSA